MISEAKPPPRPLRPDPGIWEKPPSKLIVPATAPSCSCWPPASIGEPTTGAIFRCDCGRYWLSVTNRGWEPITRRDAHRARWAYRRRRIVSWCHNAKGASQR